MKLSRQQDLIANVAADAALTEDQAAAAVSATLRYLKARLPSPAVGQLQELLNSDLADSSAGSNPGRFDD